MAAPALVHDQLARRHPDALPSRWTRGAVPTGLAPLDDILPSNGFQRGRLAVWAPGGGAAAILRAAALHTVAHWERAAWIDASGALSADAWQRPGSSGLLFVRPTDPQAALRAAELLARSGGFALVVLDGADPADNTPLVRCSRAAHEGGAALVLLTRATSLASVRLSSRMVLDGFRWRTTRLGEPGAVRTVKVHVDARGSGWHASTELAIPVWHDDLRLSLQPDHPDRRGER